jgi:hypothetical protein
MSPLLLKRSSVWRSSGQWRDDDYVLENGVVVGRARTAEAPFRTVIIIRNPGYAAGVPRRPGG